MNRWCPQGNEVDPALASVDADGLQLAVAEAQLRGGRWQLVVWRGEHCLIDRRASTTGPDLYWLWSASKPFIALLVWQQIEAGVLEPDAPLTCWWPEFGRFGKDRITLRQVLQHRSGLPTGPGGRFADALAMADWGWSIRRLELAKPRWPPGQKAAYHYLSYGFLLGEVLRRATGRELPELMAASIFEPLGMGASYLGLPPSEISRAVPMRIRAPGGHPVAALLNRPQTRQAVIPAAGVSSTAGDLARFYRAMLGGGILDGVRVISAASLAQMRRPSTVPGEVDGLLGYCLNWSQGFQLGGPGSGWPLAEPFGALSSRQSFGHNGSGVCTGWADPADGLVVAYLSDTMRGWWADLSGMRRLADALRS